VRDLLTSWVVDSQPPAKMARRDEREAVSGERALEEMEELLGPDRAAPGSCGRVRIPSPSSPTYQDGAIHQEEAGHWGGGLSAQERTE
jgi:hypothetical protein